MDSRMMDYLCCPACKAELELESKKANGSEILSGYAVCRTCDKNYEIGYGLPNLVSPDAKELPEIDTKFRKQYEQIAASYDRTVRLMLLLFGIWEPWARKQNFVRPLQLKKGDSVLEVSAGTGSNLPIIAKQIGEEGSLFALDLSPGMLTVARDKVKRKGIRVNFALGNAAYLPYKDNSFDSVLHFGGINTFGEKDKAIAEMVRVAKPGARVVIGDEGLAPGKENTRLGRWLLKQNKLYAHKPPKELVPDNVNDFRIRWIWRGAFYVMEMSKGQEQI